MKSAVVALVLAVCVALCVGENANVVVKKTVLTENLAVGREVEVEFEVWNIGTSTAYDLKFDDNQYGGKFELKEGSFEASWERLAPAANESLKLTLVAVADGETTLPPAKLTFKQEKEDPDTEIEVVWSTTPKPTNVLTARAYAKYFEPHYREWAKFCVLAVGPVVVPGLVYGFIQMSYQDGISKSAFRLKKD
jgi:hypothetical protein